MLSFCAPNGCARVLIGRKSHCTSVENHDICLGSSANTAQTRIGKLALNGRPIGLGGATSEVLNVVTLHGVIIAAERGARFTSQPESVHVASEVIWMTLSF